MQGRLLSRYGLLEGYEGGVGGDGDFRLFICYAILAICSTAWFR